MAEAFQVYMKDGKGLGFTQENYYDVREFLKPWNMGVHSLTMN